LKIEILASSPFGRIRSAESPVGNLWFPVWSAGSEKSYHTGDVSAPYYSTIRYRLTETTQVDILATP